MMLKTKDRPAPNPTYMSEEQMAHYLSDLRQTRPARPSGARPAPTSILRGPRRAEAPVHGDKDVAAFPKTDSAPSIPTHKLSHRRTDSSLSAKNISSAATTHTGRPLARPLSTTTIGPLALTEETGAVRRAPSMSYMERGTRWMEKQETKSLRQALEDMDLEEERRIHDAAQDEAAELVWKHRNPQAAQAPAVFANPDLGKDYRSHLRKGSYARNNSQDTASTGQRSASDGSQSSEADKTTPSTARMSIDRSRKVTPPTAALSNPKRRESSGKSYDHLAETVAKDIAVAHRRSSSGSRRILSGEKKMYMHPEDKIWEDPSEEDAIPVTQCLAGEGQQDSAPPPATQPMPVHLRKNPFARVRAQYEKLDRSNSAPIMPALSSAPMMRPDRVEIQRNPPSQSRNPWYMSNEPLPPTPPSLTDRDADEVAPKTTPTKDSKEIRSDDIRAATSKTRNDYSANLPRPTVVSDKAGRPIVSFEKDWKPKEIVLEEKKLGPRVQGGDDRAKLAKSSTFPAMPPPSPSRAQIPHRNVNQTATPAVPMISLSDESAIPSILLPGHQTNASTTARNLPSSNAHVPSIDISGPEDEAHNAKNKLAYRPTSPARPFPRHAATAPVPQTKSTPHSTPSLRLSGTQCAQCAHPIAGRILSAAGQRFHPECFVCHACNTNLECVAFYPEPEKQRLERLEGEDDADGAQLRFYCHLDFHELFSPRCKSCKTPIEGEVVMACGAEWHVGHFFCAQCGDPFDPATPFVEKDGYAWCVGCHTNRYSPKCRKCRKPVVDVVVKALGSEWHAACFVCTECDGEFADGRYFLRGESNDPVCVRCEERRLKA